MLMGWCLIHLHPVTAGCVSGCSNRHHLHPNYPVVLAQAEIGPNDPHHGPGAVGASALQKALARIQGDKAERIMSKYTAPDEVIELPGHCMACNAEAVTRVFQTSIPYFKVRLLSSRSSAATALGICGVCVTCSLCSKTLLVVSTLMHFG